MQLNTAKLLIRADDNLWILVIIIKKYFVLPLLLFSLFFFLPARYNIEALQRSTSRVTPSTGAVSKTNENTLKTQNTAVNSPQNVQIEQYVASEAQKVGVNPIIALWIIGKESQDGQRMEGDDGDSIGVWMWDLKQNPWMTRDCAMNLACSTRFALTWLKEGQENKWSTFACKYVWFYKDAVATFGLPPKGFISPKYCKPI